MATALTPKSPERRWWPIGRLYVISPSKRDELFRRIRKGRFAGNLLKLLVGVIALAPLLEEIGASGVKSDASLALSFLGLAAVLGIIGPAAVFGKRVRRFVRTGMTRVHPTSKAARALWMFNLAFLDTA